MDIHFLMAQWKATPQRVASLLEGISSEEARLRPTPDDWSVLEVINHLVDEEIQDFRSHLDFILAPQGKEWERIDPQAWIVERKYNERELTPSLENFMRERAASIAWLESLGNVDWDITHTSQFGSMRAGDMFTAWVAHDGLHQRQLVELQRFLVERAAKPYEVGYAGDW